MRIQTIETGFFSTEHAAMFGLYPARARSRYVSAESRNRCDLSMRVVFADLGRHKVLFDAGVGGIQVPGMSYYRMNRLQSLPAALQALGYRAEDVTDLVFSHLHFDHCGGAIQRNADGRFSPVFPHATHWVGKGQYEAAKNPSMWEKSAFAPQVLETLEREAGLRLVEADGPLFPQVRVELYQGHTTDQLVSWIEPSESEQDAHAVVVIPSDVIPMKPHLKPMCISPVDNEAWKAVEEKNRLLKAIKKQHATVYFYHDPLETSVQF